MAQGAIRDPLKADIHTCWILGGYADKTTVQMDSGPQSSDSTKERLAPDTYDGSIKRGAGETLRLRLIHVRFQGGKKMATSKQYELLFTLKAQMDSAFGTGFTSARTYISNLEGEIKKYNQTLRDIDAYRKHIDKINEHKTALEKEKKALAETEAKIAANGKSTKELTKEKENHEKAIDRLTQKIKKEEQAANERKEALEAEKVSVDRLAEAEAELIRKRDEAQKVAEDFIALKNTVTDLANEFSVLKIGADAAFNAVKAIDAAVVDCLNSAAQLEYTMSGVEATSGATKEQTEALTEAAKYMGATTSYTASECAEALQTQALAGWTVEEMLNGLPAVVQLAAASQEDLNTMTGIVSDSLNAFGLSGSEAVTRFADVLAKTATSSNTTVSMLGESLSYVESTAANLDYKIEDVSIALAVMANNALKGSVSGSALNTMLTRMSGANENAAQEMDKLGLSMYDSSGNAKDLIKFMDELRAAFGDGSMSAQEMQISAYKLAGQRGMRGLLSIVNTSQEEWEQMTADIYDAVGAANEMSNIRLDNYRGQMFLLESAADALKTTVGEAYLPLATGTAEVLTGATNAVNDFAGAHQDLLVPLSVGITTFGGVAGAIGATGTALQVAKYALDMFMPEWTTLIATTAGFAGGIGIVAGVLSAIAIAGRELYNETDFAKAQEDLKEYKKTAEEARQSAYNAVESGDYESQREQLKSMEDELTNATWKANDLANRTGELRDIAQSTGDNVDWLNWQNAEQQQQEAQAELEKTREAYFALKEAVAAQVQEEMDSIGVTELTTEQYDELSGAISTLAGDYAFIYNNTLEAIDGIYGFGKAVQKIDKEITLDTMTKSLEEQIKQLDDYTTNLEKVYKVAAEQNIDLSAIESTITDGSANAIAYVQQLADGGASAIQSVVDKAGELEDAKNKFANLVTMNNDGIQIDAINVADMIAFDDEEMQSKANEAVQAIVSSMDGAFRENTTSVSTMIGNYINMGLTDGMADTTAVSATGEVVGKAATDGVAAGAGTHSPSTITEEVGRNVDEGLIIGMDARRAEVEAKAASIGQAATIAFQRAMTQNAFYSAASAALQGAVNGINSKKNDLIAAARSAGQQAANAYKNASTGIKGYASGTTNAEPGWKLVGENGPEIVQSVGGAASIVGANGPQLMPMSGGETVYTASETRSILNNGADLGITNTSPIAGAQGAQIEQPQTGRTDGGIVQITYAPQITANGSTNADDIKAMMSEHSQELLGMIENYLAEREASQRRRAY